MPRLRQILLRTLACLLLLSLLALGIIGWIGSAHLVSPPRRTLKDYHREILAAPERHGLSITRYTGPRDTPCLLVTPATQPGPAQKARQLRTHLRQRGIAPAPWGELRGTVILLHGHRGRKEDHLPICERFCAAGFRCIVPDLPGHGEHPSGIATFGKKEAALIEAIHTDTLSTFGLPEQPAFLFGISQGGAIALQTAARNPDRWAGVASAASFASLDRPILRSAKTLHPALRPFAPLSTFAVQCGTWCRSGMWPPSVRPARAASQLTLPAFIAHGEEDRFIPLGEAREIFTAIPCRNKTFRPVARANHHQVLSADAANFYPDLCTFFIRSLQPDGFF